MPTDSRRQFRKQPTEAEDVLWRALRNRQIDGHKFRRQHPIGQFVTDFCCPKAHLIIEVDGGIHAQQSGADREREAYLSSLGYRVVRVGNSEVLENLEAVLAQIRSYLGEVGHKRATAIRGTLAGE